MAGQRNIILTKQTWWKTLSLKTGRKNRLLELVELVELDEANELGILADTAAELLTYGATLPKLLDAVDTAGKKEIGSSSAARLKRLPSVEAKPWSERTAASTKPEEPSG